MSEMNGSVKRFFTPLCGKENDFEEWGHYIVRYEDNFPLTYVENIWVVTKALPSVEDTTNLWIRTMNPYNLPHGQYDVGVNFSTLERKVSLRRFRYQPAYGNQYTIARNGNYPVHNEAGYNVGILDPLNPSQHFHCGLIPNQDRHVTYDLVFTLMPVKVARELVDGGML